MKKTLADSLEKFFGRNRTLEITHEGQTMKFMVKPVTADEQREYIRLASEGSEEAAKNAIDYIYRTCLMDEDGKPLFTKDEEISLPPIARQAISGRLLNKAFGSDLSGFEIKN